MHIVRKLTLKNEREPMKISVLGMGYVGLSNAILLAQDHEVHGFDISEARVNMINNQQCPFVDQEMVNYLQSDDLNLRVTHSLELAIQDAVYVVIATPTNYDPETNRFDTSSVEKAALEVTTLAPNALIVIKSTVPVGFVLKLRETLSTNNIIFSPEFLREGNALYDNLHPSRIVVGERSERARQLSELLKASSLENDTPILLTDPSEAEAIKLFSNTFLAMRVAFFNELDSYGLATGIDPNQVIDGVCLDPRIGNYYNNPSFGYGGYCLPKDTRQLLANYDRVPQNLIKAIVDANETRKDFLSKIILETKPNVVGIYRLVMKQGADNWRESSVQGIIQRLNGKGVEIVIYEPSLSEDTFLNSKVFQNLETFKSKSDLIIANRLHSDLDDVRHRVFTRDMFGKN